MCECIHLILKFDSVELRKIDCVLTLLANLFSDMRDPPEKRETCVTTEEQKESVSDVHDPTYNPEEETSLHNISDVQDVTYDIGDSTAKEVVSDSFESESGSVQYPIIKVVHEVTVAQNVEGKK